MAKFDIFMMAYKNLMRRKGRTFLTVLGVLIGTTSIVVMISLGIGLRESQTKMMEQWGSLNQIEVNEPWSRGGDDEEEAPKLVLNQATVDEFKAIPGVVAVSPAIRVNGQASWGKREGYLNIQGVDVETMALFQHKVSAGRLLEEGDGNTLILGATTSENFTDVNGKYLWDTPNYEYDEAAVLEDSKTFLDKKLTMMVYNNDGTKTKKVGLTVVGVLDITSPGGRYNCYAPIDAMKQIKKFMDPKSTGKNKNKNEFNGITILTDGVENTKLISASLKEQGYDAYSIADNLEGIEKQSKMIQAVLAGIGSITLLVAAIGIINTMIMSIFERTREIGIMKVIGATFGDIRLLFLTEAGLIGFFGGVVGLMLSCGLSYLLNTLGAGFMGGGGGAPGAEAAPMSVIPPWLLVFAIVFSILIGVLAGLYPANRAVKLSPIEAMRNN